MPDVVPPAKVSGKFDCTRGSSGSRGRAVKVTLVVPTPVKSQPPCGWAPATLPVAVVDGTTCLTTVIEPSQLPRARARKAAPAAA